MGGGGRLCGCSSRPLARRAARAPSGPKRVARSMPGQGGQVAEGAQAEADQQVGEVGAVEGRHRERGQEGAAAARAGRWPGGGRPGRRRRCRRRSRPGSRPPALDGGVDGGGHGDGQGRLAAVVAGGAAGREGALARLEDLDPGGELLDRDQHRLEGAGVAGRVVGQQLQLRAAPLGLAPAQAGPDPLGPGGRRAGDDAVGVDDGRQAVRRRPGGHHRPVRAPDHQHAGHRGSPHPASASGSSGGPADRGIPFPGEGRTGGSPDPGWRADLRVMVPSWEGARGGPGVRGWRRRGRRRGPRPGGPGGGRGPGRGRCQALEVTARRRSAGSGPGAEGDQDRSALAGPGREAAGLGGREPGRGAHQHHVDRVQEGGDHGRPGPGAGDRDQGQALKGDAGLGGGHDPQVGQADRGDPGAGRRGPGHQGQGEGGGAADGHRGAPAQSPAGEQRLGGLGPPAAAARRPGSFPVLPAPSGWRRRNSSEWCLRPLSVAAIGPMFEHMFESVKRPPPRGNYHGASSGARNPRSAHGR